MPAERQIRVTADLHEKLTKLASESGRTLGEELAHRVDADAAAREQARQRNQAAYDRGAKR